MQGIREEYLSVKNKGQGVEPQGGASPYKTLLPLLSPTTQTI